MSKNAVEELNLVPVEPSLPQERKVQPTTLLGVIAQAATDPRCDIDKMERLLAMQQAVMKDQREAAYKAALARLQAKLPQIEKHGIIPNRDGSVRSRYAKLEDIDVVLRPLLAEEGFSISFNSESKDGHLFTLLCTLAHSEGHSETNTLLLPLDASEYRTKVQSTGSTMSYGRRQLIKMHLNLIEKDDDDGGQGGSEPITEQQVSDLAALMKKSGASVDRFLQYMRVQQLSDILQRDYQKAVNALEQKRRSQ